jgi:hypothetical protein
VAAFDRDIHRVTRGSQADPAATAALFVAVEAARPNCERVSWAIQRADGPSSMNDQLIVLHVERSGVRNRARYLRAEIHSLDLNNRSARTPVASEERRTRLKELERRDRELTTQIAELASAKG